jgi:hypothetical protein
MGFPPPSLYGHGDAGPWIVEVSPPKQEAEREAEEAREVFPLPADHEVESVADTGEGDNFVHMKMVQIHTGPPGFGSQEYPTALGSTASHQ